MCNYRTPWQLYIQIFKNRGNKHVMCTWKSDKERWVVLFLLCSQWWRRLTWRLPSQTRVRLFQSPTSNHRNPFSHVTYQPTWHCHFIQSHLNTILCEFREIFFFFFFFKRMEILLKYCCRSSFFPREEDIFFDATPHLYWDFFF